MYIVYTVQLKTDFWLHKRARPKSMLPQETYFKYKDKNSLKMKFWGNIYHVNTSKKKCE